MPTVDASELELQGAEELVELEPSDYSQGIKEPDKFPSLLVKGVRTNQELDFFTSLSSKDDDNSVLMYIDDETEVFPVGYFQMVLGELLKLKFMGYGLTLYLEEGSFPLETPDDFLNFAQLGDPVNIMELDGEGIENSLVDDDLLTLDQEGHYMVVNPQSLEDIL